MSVVSPDRLRGLSPIVSRRSRRAGAAPSRTAWVSRSALVAVVDQVVAEAGCAATTAAAARPATAAAVMARAKEP